MTSTPAAHAKGAVTLPPTRARNWAVGLSVSVALHALAAGVLLLLASKPVAAPKPAEAPLQVLRVGVLPRAAATPGAMGAEARPAVAPPVRRPLVMKFRPHEKPGATELTLGDEATLGDAAAALEAVMASSPSGDDVMRGVLANLDTEEPGDGLPAGGSGPAGGGTSAPSDWTSRAFGVSNAAVAGGTGVGRTSPIGAPANAATGRGASAGGSGAGRTPAGGLGAAGSDAPPDVVSLVHARLAAAASRCYPATARRFHQQGEVELRFCVDAAGALARPSVGASSNVASLDRAAVECVAPQAAPFPAPAAGHCFRVPVRFGRASR